MKAFQEIVYSNRKNHENIHENIIANHQQIEGWFRNQWLKYPAPFYSSIDIRNSGFKISPIDTNLFPAVTYSDSKSLLRLLKPAGNKLVSMGEILNPEFLISIDE